MNEDFITWFNRNSAEIHRRLAQHMVGLNWADMLREPRSDSGDVNRDIDVQVRQATAFFLESGGYSFLMTAGHVLTAMRQCITGERSLLKAQLHDSLHLDAPTPAIPFPLLDSPMFLIDDEEAGLDYGAILVPRHFARLMIANGCLPISSELWSDCDQPDFDIFTLLGFPIEQRSQATTVRGVTTNVALRSGCPLIPIAAESDPPSMMVKTFDRFYGKIHARIGEFEGNEILLADINGMSGGPLFGLARIEGGFRYRLIGVQSSWDESSGIIGACHIASFARIIAQKTVAWIESNEVDVPRE